MTYNHTIDHVYDKMSEGNVLKLDVYVKMVKN